MLSPSRIRTSSDRSAWWQAALILAPIALLAALGVRGLEVSRRALHDNARAECERLAMQLHGEFTNGLRALANESPLPKSFPELPTPAEPNEAQALFRQASEPGGEDPLTRLHALETDYPDARAESGIPLLPLVLLAQLRLETSPEASRPLAERLARAAVESHPSVLTPQLLDSAAALLQGRGLELTVLTPWRARWQEEEQRRAAMHAVTPQLPTLHLPAWLRDPQTGAPAWWLGTDNSGKPRHLIAKPRLESLAHATADSYAAITPAYAATRLSLAGEELATPLLGGEELARVASDTAEISLLLVHPERLYAQQRTQTLWLSALLASAVVAALAGFYVLRRALFRERQLGELKSNFVASISHELRAPIASMRVMAENLETGVVHEERRRGEYHRLISEECRRLSSLIDNVLDFARIEQNRKTYRFEETEVIALTQDAIELMEPRAAQRRQTIARELSTIDPPPFCDGMAVQQALINLLDNAIKFSPPGAAITVTLGPRDPGEWALSVADSGSGIPAAEHRRIFERFYRIGSELQRETQGAGIGLSIVQHIVEAHGGRIEIASAPGEGARFTLLFPLRPPGVQPHD